MKKPQKSKTLRALQAGLIASALLAAPAFGARLAYEGFDYTEADGTSINGLNGGDFWDEAFPSPSGTIALAPALAAHTGTGAPAPVGKAMKFSSGANLGLGRDWADASVPLANGSVYWYSLYVNPSYDSVASPTASGRGTLVPFKSLGNANGQEGFGVRIDSNVVSGVARPQFKAWHPNQSGGANIDFPANTGKTYFVLGRVDINTGGNSTNRIWVYEDPSAIPTTEPAVGTAMSTATAAWTIGTNQGADSLRTTLSGRAFGNPNPGISYDEIRVATTFAEVFPAPPGVPTFALDPITAVQNQTLTFNWTNLPPGSNPTLNGSPIVGAVTPDGSTTLPAPAINTTYTLNWTGAVTPLTQNFTAIAPFLTISPSSGYLGDTLTLNWRVPAGSAAITLTPNTESHDLDTLTDSSTGIGTAQIPAPTSPTLYTINWTGGGAGVSQTFTLLPSFLNVTPDPVAAGTALAINWRISPEWDDNPVAANEVRLQSSATSDFSVLYDDAIVTTNGDTGAGSDNSLTAAVGVNYFRLVYNINDVQTTVSDTISTFEPYFTNLVYTPTAPEVKEWTGFASDVKAYTDRDAIWKDVPAVLVGGHYLRLRQGDKKNTSLGVTFDAPLNSTVFVLVDNRVGDGVGGTNPIPGSDNPPVPSALPWLAAEGFLDSGLDVGSEEFAFTPPGIDNTYSIFFKHVGPVEETTDRSFALGSLDTDSPSIESRGVYGVVIVKPQVVPVSFHAYPGMLDLIVNPGSTSTLYWTLPTDATAIAINSVAGPLSIDGNGQGSVIVSPTATTTYTLTASSASLGPISRQTTVTVVAPLTGFGTWITGNFSGNTVPSGQQGPNDDPDGDGIDNLVEYAITGGDPTRSNSSPAVISGTLVTFNKNTAATGISYALEKSSTLANDWVPATAETNDANVITYRLAPPAPTKEFVRLKVTQN